MDVLKDFELRQVGSRLVLRQICPPDENDYCCR